MTREGRFRRILAVCALDGTDPDLLALGAALTAGGEAATAMAAVERPAEIDRLARFAGRSPEALEAQLVEETRGRLEASLAENAGSWTPVVRVGRPFVEVIREALGREVDLVIKRADTVDAPRRRFLASTDQHLLRKCPAAVWLRRGPLTAGADVIAAVDLDPAVVRGEAEEGPGPLNDRILTAGIEVASHTGGALHVLHAWEAPAEMLVRRWSGTEEEVAGYVRQVRRERREALDRLCEAARARVADGVRVVPHLVEGLAREVIPTQVSALDADTLVMGTIGRVGIPGFIIGNTAEDVLNAVDCSLLTVKPPGYVSPVAE